jgi:hypothetical protein
MRHSGAVEFAFRSTGSGWGTGATCPRFGRVDLPASYLFDAVGEVLLAIAELKDRQEAAVASWEQEPGEHKWLFRRTPR